MNDQSGGSSKSLLIGVKVDRFWNQHWRLLLFVGVIILSSITGGTASHVVHTNRVYGVVSVTDSRQLNEVLSQPRRGRGS